MMNRKPPPNKIVAKFTEQQLREQEIKWRTEGADLAYNKLKDEREALARQKAQIDLDQTKAVTDLLRAASESLSKAGYLIGKLNKDTSR